MPLKYVADATVDIGVQSAEASVNVSTASESVAVDINIQSLEISLDLSPSSGDVAINISPEEKSVTLPVYASDSTPITTGDLSVITTLEFEDTDHVIQPPIDGYKSATIDPLPSREEESFTLDLLPVQFVPFIFEVQTDNLVYHDYDYYRYRSGTYTQYTTDPNHSTLGLELNSAGNSFHQFLTEVTWLPSATPSTGAAVISSPSDSYTLPTVDGGVYNCTVEWGDGTTSTITSWNQSEVTHQYSSAGKYKIVITGKFEGINFHRHEELNHHDHLKLLDVISWGEDSKMDIAGWVAPFNPHGIPISGSNGIHAGSVGMFCGCRYWNDVSGGAPNWGTCGTAKTLHPTSDGRQFGGSALITTFYGNSSLQADISVWTTEEKPFTGGAYRHFQFRPRASDVDTFKANFHWTPSNGNQWQLFSATSFVSSEGNSLIYSNKNHRFEVSNWKPLSETVKWQSSFAGNDNMDPDVSDLVNSKCSAVAYMFSGADSFTGRGLENWDISGLNTNGSNSAGFTNAFESTPINKILPWTFAFGARISGMLTSCSLYNSPCNGWGTSGVKEANSLFFNSGSFNNGGVSWTDADWTNCEAFGKMFRDTAFNQDVSRWKLSTTRDFKMSEIFMNTPFNRPVNTTMVDGVKYWDMSRCTSTSYMFRNTPFNQSLDSWDVSNVTNMKGMFSTASSFNQPLIAWDVSSVTNMAEMFNVASSFDQDLSGWDVSNVKTMTNTFLNANAFTGQGLITWAPTSALKSMSQTFYSTALAADTDLGAWDVSGVTTLNRCFYNTDLFTGVNLDQWDVSSVEDMTLVFNESSKVNPDVSGWDVSSVKNLKGMFKAAPDFNRNLASWNLSSLVQNVDVYEIPYGSSTRDDFDYGGDATLADGTQGVYSGIAQIFKNSGMSKTNLDLTISGWCDSDNTPNGSTVPGGDLQLGTIPLDNSGASQRLDSATITKMESKNMTAKYTDGTQVPT